MAALSNDFYAKVLAFWQSRKIDTVDELDLVLDNFRILFAYHSGKIENQQIEYHDTREIFENGRVVGFSGDPRTLFEQQNQKLCYEYLKSKIIEREEISLELVKDVHRILTSGVYDETRFVLRGERPGEFKKHDYVTGINEVGYAPNEVENAIRDLLDEVNQSLANPLKTAAYFHASFEFIHPFADGNGRVGRTLMNYYLMTHGHPPLIVYDENKKDYYRALEQYDVNEDIQPLFNYLREETMKTWTKTLERTLGLTYQDRDASTPEIESR